MAISTLFETMLLHGQDSYVHKYMVPKDSKTAACVHGISISIRLHTFTDQAISVWRQPAIVSRSKQGSVFVAVYCVHAT